MSDELLAFILTLSLFTLMAVWVPILDILQGAVRDWAMTKTIPIPNRAGDNVSSTDPGAKSPDFNISQLRDEGSSA